MPALLLARGATSCAADLRRTRGAAMGSGPLEAVQQLLAEPGDEEEHDHAAEHEPAREVQLLGERAVAGAGGLPDADVDRGPGDAGRRRPGEEAPVRVA